MARHIIATGSTAYCGAKADPSAEHEQDYQAVYNGRTRPGTCPGCARWLTEKLDEVAPFDSARWLAVPAGP